LAAYVDCLAEFDRAAALGIFGAPHRQLTRLARHAGVLYKPSGAGGGDMGVAFALDSAALATFAASARAAGFSLPAMEPDQHGIEVITRQR
jgi:phosphomevalonate kinase